MASHANLQKQREALTRCYVTSHWHEVWVNKGTVEPRYNEPRYNEDPVIKNNIWKPGRFTVKYVETNPAITKSPL